MAATIRRKSAPPAENDENMVIFQALAILERRIRRGDIFNAPHAARQWLVLRLAEVQREVFGVLYLDAQNRLIEAEDLFLGTLTQTAVYPREVVKGALARNAGAVILYHNHPSGVAEPSRSDELLTTALKQALALVDVKVLDHFVVGGTQCVSFAERGLI